jgi:hypothetical protein
MKSYIKKFTDFVNEKFISFPVNNKVFNLFEDAESKKNDFEKRYESTIKIFKCA